MWKVTLRHVIDLGKSMDRWRSIARFPATKVDAVQPSMVHTQSKNGCCDFDGASDAMIVSANPPCFKSCYKRCRVRVVGAD